MALRCGLGAQVDLAVLKMALAAVAGDGRARCVKVSSASLSSAGFIADVQAMLDAAPQAASLLVIELGERSLGDARRWIAQACARWRRAGCHIGLAHAGAALHDVPRLQELGIEHAKIDAAFVQDVAAQPAMRAHARSLVTLLHGLQIQVLADGVDDAGDLAVLWALGFDGAGGLAVEQPAAG